MKLLVLCIFAMMATLAMSRSWTYVQPKFLNKAFEVALKEEIIVRWDRKLAKWLRVNGGPLSHVQKKALYFVNRRYMQTHWANYMLWINKKTDALGRTPVVGDYRRLGAEIGRRIDMVFFYKFLSGRNMIPKYMPYMEKINRRANFDNAPYIWDPSITGCPTLNIPRTGISELAMLRREVTAGKYRAAMKKGILTGFHRQLDGWLVEHGKTVNNKQKKILRFVNIRYMQTHWPSFFKFALDRLKKLGRKPTERDFLSIGAEIGRRVPIRFSYSVLISQGLLPAWADYMQDLLDTPPGKVKCRNS